MWVKYKLMRKYVRGSKLFIKQAFKYFSAECMHFLTDL